MSIKPKIVVLGAGPGGLCAAWNLVQEGYDVVVLEKGSVCGGQSITFQKGDYKYNLGPHNIHSRRKSVINFIKKNLGDEFITHRYFSQIYFRGKRINYPLEGMDVLRSLSAWTALECALSFVWTRILSCFIPSYQDNGRYETWIINRFGKKFYDIYFGPYSEKVWKIPPREISDIVAKKRIAVTGLVELVRSIFFKKQNYHPENPRLNDNYHPKQGVGQIIDFFVDGIVKNGGKIITNASVDKIVVDKNSVQQVHYSENGVKKQIDCRVTPAKILSTMPINELILMLDGPVPAEVKTAAEGLDFVSEVFLYLNVKKTDIFEVPLLYFSEPEFPFNRVYDIGMFSREMVPTGKNALCLEVSCNYNDETWNIDEKTLFEKCMIPLEKHGLLQREEVEEYHTQRLKHAYPRFRMGYEKKLETILNYMDTVPNLLTFGRQGLFSYTNVDDALWMGFEIAKQVNFHSRINVSLKELLLGYLPF